LSFGIIQPKPGKNIGTLSYYDLWTPDDVKACPDPTEECLEIEITEFDLRVEGYIAGTYNSATGISGSFRGKLTEFNFQEDAPLSCIGIGTWPGACDSIPEINLYPTVEGGVMPYTFAWSDGTIGELTTNGEGLYTVIVTDYLGTSCVLSYDYTYLRELQYELSITEPDCDMENGSAIIEVQNFSDFTITWPGGVQGNSLMNAGEGVYNAFIRYGDNYSCTVVVPVTLDDGC